MLYLTEFQGTVTSHNTDKWRLKCMTNWPSDKDHTLKIWTARPP